MVSTQPAIVTADALADPSLEALARSLAASLPCTDQISLVVAGLLTKGRPVARRDLATTLGLTEPQATARTATEQMPHLELDTDGRIVGCGLTLVPTEHWIAFSGPRLYTWCAFDTVLFPALLGRSAEVRSRCHATGIPIRCSISPDGSENVGPAAAVISLVVPERAVACCDVRGSFCQHVHFFASPAAGAAWQAATHTGHLISVADAHAIARRIRALSGCAG